MKRRSFIKRALGTSAAAAAGVAAPTLWLPKSAKASWGELPSTVSSGAMLSPANTTKKVLEVFLYGGISAWETFGVVPEYGKPDDPTYPNQQWWTFQNTMPSVMSTVGECGIPLEERNYLEHFGVDDIGMDVFLGPVTWPLRARADIASRMRTLVHFHPFEPHEAAIPKMLSGRGLGDPKLAGMGAAVANYYGLQSLESVPAPFAYTFLAPIVGADGAEAASSVGSLPASARPLTVKLQSTGQTTNLLARNNVAGHKEQLDSLIALYRNRYEDLYKRPGFAEPLRSTALSDYAFATGLLAKNDVLQDILTPELLQISQNTICGDTSNNLPGAGVRIATELLQRPVDAARYACVIDSGFIGASGGGGYDTHSNHTHDFTRNLYNTLSALANNINEPGEGDPNKLDLDETMIVLTSEFGRWPMAEGATGRGHWPYGFCSVMIGGSIGPEQKGYVGNIDAAGYAETYVTAEEFRAALLLAMGIWPFEAETWAVGNVRAGFNEESAALWLKEVVLGHGV